MSEPDSFPPRSNLSFEDQFSISLEDVNRLLEMRRIFYAKENERKLSKLGLPLLVEPDDSLSSSPSKPIRRRDMEWLSIVLPHIKKYNSHCGVCASSKNYGRRLDMANSYLLRSYFYCQGRDCPFNCVMTIKENGKGLLCSRFSNGNIIDHRNAKRVARPNRSSINKDIKRSRKSSNGILHQWNADELPTNFNLSTADFDDNPTKRFVHMCCNLMQLTRNLRQEIEPTGLLPGALQHLSLNPFHIAVHTENSIRYYHSMLTKKALDRPPPVIHVKPVQTINSASQSKTIDFFVDFVMKIFV